jgi:hypothetical protein
MTLIEKIQQLIVDGYKYKVDAQKEDFILVENGKDATCREAKFKKTCDIAVFKFDEDIKGITDKFPFLKDKSPNKSMCDYLIFYAYKNDIHKTYCFVCNLKSGNSHNNSDQLEAGRIFGEFIINTAIRVYNSEMSNKPQRKIDENTDVKFVKVSFSNQNKNVNKSIGTKIKLVQQTPKLLSFKCGEETCNLDFYCN